MNEERFDDEFTPFASEPDARIHANVREHGNARNRLALQMLKQTRDSLTHVIQLLEEGDTARATRHLVDVVSQKRQCQSEMERVGGRMVEGVFDGEAMVGADGVRYAVPENYASKSKLVEGDMLKLIIKSDGGFLFKQIGPIERTRFTGTLNIDSSTQESVVVCAQGVYKVLAASVSYHKGIPGDDVTILVPKGGMCVWAAIERVNN